MGVTPATNAIGGFTTTTVTTGAVTMDATLGLKVDSGATTATQGVNLQLTQTPFVIAAGKPVWMEGSFRITGSAGLKSQLLFGLAAASTALIATSAVSTADMLAFTTVTTAGAVLANATSSTTAGTAAAFTYTDATTYRLGIYATTTAAQFWVNGAVVQTLVANIPTTALAPSIVCQSNGTTQPIVYIKWLRVAGIY